jgi:osmoprotectant transport system permease protein
MDILISLLSRDFDSRTSLRADSIGEAISAFKCFLSNYYIGVLNFLSTSINVAKCFSYLKNFLPLKGGLRWGLKILIVTSMHLYIPSYAHSASQIKVGSKAFTESVIIGDLITQLAESAGTEVKHRKQLGGTRVLWDALIRGDIDIYPEYTGTIMIELLAGKDVTTEDGLERALSEKGILMSKPLGFNNTYAIGMKEEVADRLGIKEISDLRKHPDLSFGFTNEFMDRADGWPSLQMTYKLPQKKVRGLDHDLAYRGLEGGGIQVADLYSTDAEIRYYDLRVLEDDLKHFPNYNAVLLYRSDLGELAPGALDEILKLQGQISEKEMIEMNAMVKIEGESDSEVASEFLKNNLSISTHPRKETFMTRLARNTLQHLFLVVVSLSAAILISIPLGIWAHRNERLGQAILGIVGIIQTIPSLALLVFMIPLLGIGATPAIVALFLYSLLPIVRNTHTGLHDIPSNIRESAEALGLSYFARLRLVELPMASRSIIGGIKTSAVINVGTATLGALIGAGGYGQPILTGIRLDNIPLILEGAVPAAVLALLVQGLFDLSELVFVPKGLRLKSE